MSTSEDDKRQELFGDAWTHRLSRRELLYRAGLVGLGGASLALLGAGCGGKAAEPAATGGGTVSTRGNDLFISAVYGDIDMWDPALLNGSKPAQTAIQNTMDQLTQYAIVEKQLDDGTPYSTYDAENIVPMLAESWERKGNDLIFTMRDGVKFTNGDPADANTVLAAYQRFFGVQGIATFLLGMGGSVTDPKQLEVVDAKTFVIHMSKPNDLTPKNIVMGNTSITDDLEVKAKATGDDPWALSYYKKNYPAGTGPYKFDAYTPGDNITLVRNETYWGKPPQFAKVIQKIIPDATQRVLLLKSGDVDIIDNVPLKELNGLKKDSNIRVLPVPTTYVYLAGMNNKMPPFDKKEVRQAVSYAIPYDAIIKEVLFGYGKRLYGPVPFGQGSYDPSIKKYETNLDTARDLLAQAGFKDGDGLPDIKLSIVIGMEEAERTAVVMQGALRNINMNIEIEKLALPAFNEKWFGKKCQMGLWSWDMWVNDPYYNMSWVYTTGGANNGSDYSNARVDDILNKYALYPSGDERDNASKEAQRIILDEAAFLWLYQMVWPVAMRSDVAGYAFYNDTLLRYHSMYRNA